jgi:hypothetical protein
MSVKKEKSPSIFGVYFFAVLMAIFSAFLGFVYLLGFPAKAFSSQQAYGASFTDKPNQTKSNLGSARIPGDVYYIVGPTLNSRSWESKRAQMQAEEPSTVRLSSGEINAWMNAAFRSSVAPPNPAASDVLIMPKVPNVSIAGDESLTLSLPTRVEGYGRKYDMIVFARMVPVAGQLRFESCYVSNAKLPMPNLLGSALFEKLSQSYQATDEYRIISNALSRADSIYIDRGELVLELR